jgi:uncharacterized protein (TIGR02246 family)
VRHTFLRALTCLAIFGTSLVNAAGTAPAFNATDTAALNAVADHWREYWNSHDMDRFAGLFADDVDFVTKSGAWFQGKQATMEHHRKNHTSIFKDSTWTTDQVVIKYVKPDVAIIHIGWGLSGDSHHDGTASAPRHGMSTWVLTKRNGAWLLLAVQNVNIEPPK